MGHGRTRLPVTPRTLWRSLSPSDRWFALSGASATVGAGLFHVGAGLLMLSGFALVVSLAYARQGRDGGEQ